MKAYPEYPLPEPLAEALGSNRLLRAEIDRLNEERAGLEAAPELLGALRRLHEAGEAHMQAHPSDGAAWHKANADLCEALNSARDTLALEGAT